MARKRRSFKQALQEFLDAYDEDDDDSEDDDVASITVRGKDALRLLGLMDDAHKNDPPKPDDAGDDGDPPAEPGPQRGHSKYFGGGEK